LCFGFAFGFCMVGWVLFGVRLGAVSCCLGCVPAHFHVVESDAFGMLSGLRAEKFRRKKAAIHLRLLLPAVTV
jgi:hypothetical protein